MRAGLGIIRKNNFLYTERGSFVMLEASSSTSPVNSANITI